MLPRILVVDDNSGDAELVRQYAALSGLASEVLVAGTIGEAAQALEHHDVQAVLLDLGLPDATGMSGLELILSAASHAPVIMLSGRDDEPTALAAMDAGAADYLVKDSLSPSSLNRAVRFAIRRREVEKELAASEASARRLVRIVETATDIVLLIDPSERVIEANASARTFFVELAPLVGARISELLMNMGTSVWFDALGELLLSDRWVTEIQMQDPEGRERSTLR